MHTLLVFILVYGVVQSAPVHFSIQLTHVESFALQDTNGGLTVKRSLGGQAAHRQKRKASWSVDNLANDSEPWDVGWTTPAPPKLVKPKPTGKQSTSDIEVIDLRQEKEKRSYANSFWQRYGIFVIIPAAVLGGILIFVFFYFFCMKGGCCAPCCLLCTCLGRKVVHDYVPGARINEDGKVEYHELTQEEVEAAHNVADHFM